MSFKGKNAVVTGSSRGIGRGIALKLAEKGARVCEHYRRNREAAQATLEKILEAGSDGFLIQTDICKPDEVRRIFHLVCAEFGSLDIFVSNARPEASTFYQASMQITVNTVSPGWVEDSVLNSLPEAFQTGLREWQERGLDYHGPPRETLRPRLWRCCARRRPAGSPGS